MSNATNRYALRAFDFRLGAAAYSGVLNEVIEGSLNWIRFVGNQARMTAKPVNPQFPGGDENVVFHRIRSSSCG
jgi:hypothetical protein